MSIPFDFSAEIDRLILSASGFRKVFADTEESFSDTISPTNSLICAAIADAFSSYCRDVPIRKPVLVSIDARPTGPAIANIVMTVFRKRNIPFDYTGIASAPEAMCFASVSGLFSGFCYITASHNPVGHNGFKFGIGTGGVLGGDEASVIIERIRNIFTNIEYLQSLMNIINGNACVVPVNNDLKTLSLNTYTQFALATAFDCKKAESDFRLSISSVPAGIIGELNGSARGASSDPAFFSSLGVESLFFNASPGSIVHGIVPEGDNLLLCRELLEKEYNKNHCFILGYVPDNDGDRGNLVYIHEKDNKAYILKAQEVFALCVLSELLYLKYCEESNKTVQPDKYAVVVNGPTSMRIDEIGEMLGSRVFRTEVGEANVVRLAEQKRQEGYVVRIFGEGSNGGNITYPSSVRDPLNTISSILKLLRLKGNRDRKGMFESWCELCNITYNPDFHLSDIIDTIPVYCTTDAFEPEAKMNISALSHNALKTCYETILEKNVFPLPHAITGEFGNLVSEIINYEGTRTLSGAGNRTKEGNGGFKVIFKTSIDEKPVGFVWMRGSGTEPVFRIMADLKTKNKDLEKQLLAWHRTLVEAADKMASGQS